MAENRELRRSYRSARPRAAALRPPTFLQSLFILVALTALTLQVLVVQTHIHIPEAQARFATLAVGLVDNDEAAIPAPGQRDKSPVTGDQTNCPLCQGFAHSGQFVHSTSVLATIPFPVTVSFIVFREIAPVVFAASHTWRGRAPPTA